MKNLIPIILIFSISSICFADESSPPLKIGIIGLSHTHVHWIFNSVGSGDYEIVGIVESDTLLAERYLDQYNIKKELLFTSIPQFLEYTKPEAVTAFGPISEHLSVVEKFAPLGIHVMVEKPLAVNLEDAEKMRTLAEENNIHLLTNYETTWYATNSKAYQFLNEESLIGELRKIIVRSGHKGPKEIGVNKEFLDWLTDPKYNGGGAVTDFGCYGANLMTWLTKGEKPISVTAITQQLKPDVYPLVDDEATILLEYSNMQGIIQASWNWPFSRKDMEIYGSGGYIICEDRSNLNYKRVGKDGEVNMKLEERLEPYNDPFSYFAALIRGEIEMPRFDLSSLENNMIVMQILDAAIESSKSGKRIEIN